MEYYN